MISKCTFFQGKFSLSAWTRDIFCLALEILHVSWGWAVGLGWSAWAGRLGWSAWAIQPNAELFSTNAKVSVGNFGKKNGFCPFVNYSPP
jgi:hypothetical protein